MKAYSFPNGSIWFEREVVKVDSITWFYWDRNFPEYANLIRAENELARNWNNSLETGNQIPLHELKKLHEDVRIAHKAFADTF